MALGTAYLAWVGVIGGERNGFAAYAGVTGLGEDPGRTPLVLLRVGVVVRDLFAAGGREAVETQRARQTAGPGIAGGQSRWSEAPVAVA